MNIQEPLVLKWVNAAVVRLHPEFFFEPEEPDSFGVETRGMFINDDNMLNKVCEFIEKMAKQHLYMKRCSVYLGLFFDGVEDDEVGEFYRLSRRLGVHQTRRDLPFF